MDSTHLPPFKPSASKLPIKRKTPDQTQTQTPSTQDDLTITTVDFDTKPPPFKFHRIWTEPDEIRFLQGLVDSSSENLAFPRDLSLFYQRFSHSMSQPYTKSQLSEKLRRLRKKFRVTCSRISRGLDMSLMSSHDRALYGLSNQLWSPEYAGKSPFFNTNSLVGVKVCFSPDLEFNGNGNGNHDVNDDFVVDDGSGDVKMGEENVNGGGVGEEMGKVSGGGGGVGGGGIAGVVANTVLNVFEECLKEVRMAFCPDNGGLLNEMDLQRRWREQRVAELDLLARRLRLVLDNSLKGKSVCK